MLSMCGSQKYPYPWCKEGGYCKLLWRGEAEGPGRPNFWKKTRIETGIPRDTEWGVGVVVGLNQKIILGEG